LPYTCPSKKPTQPAKPDGPQDSALLERTLRAIREAGCSLTAASRNSGFSVTTLKVEATRVGISFQTRPKSLKPGKLLTVQSALASVAPLEEIAAAHHISLVSLYRILRMNPTLAQQRSSLARKDNRDFRRNRFATELEEVSARRCQDYMWLYRNDYDWLCKAMSLGAKRDKPRQPRVDWALRDKELAAEVRLHAARLYKDMPPARVTRTGISRATGRQALIEKFVARLPLTAQALREMEESIDQFKERRAAYHAAAPGPHLDRALAKLGSCGPEYTDCGTEKQKRNSCHAMRSGQAELNITPLQQPQKYSEVCDDVVTRAYGGAAHIDAAS
jgi:hypothetical protein